MDSNSWNQLSINDAFAYHYHGGMTDEDYDYLLWAMECDGIPVKMLEPIRDYFRQPVANRERLECWLSWCK